MEYGIHHKCCHPVQHTEGLPETFLPRFAAANRRGSGRAPFLRETRRQWPIQGAMLVQAPPAWTCARQIQLFAPHPRLTQTPYPSQQLLDHGRLWGAVPGDCERPFRF
jgi:hypothetical protein